jgi:GntR family transcriptional regulator
LKPRGSSPRHAGTAQAPLKRLGIARYDKAKWRDGDEVAFIADRVASGRSYGRKDQTQTVSLIEAPAAVAAAHGLPEGAQVYARARLVKEGDQPTHSLTSYYRPEHVEGTRLVDPTPGPAGRGGGFRVLYDAGYEIDHMKERLFARVPTPEETKLLQLPAGEWVVELHRTTFTASGTVVEFAIGVHAASRFAWEYDFKVPDSAQDKKGQ